MKKFIWMTAIVLSMLFALSGVVQAEEFVNRAYVVDALVTAAGTERFPADSFNQNQYTDFGDTAPALQDSMRRALANGLLFGYEDGSIRPNQSITRIEAVAILYRCMPEIAPTTPEITFSDTPAWAVDTVKALTQRGLLYGYGNGLMGAQDRITAEQTRMLAERLAALWAEAEKTEPAEDGIFGIRFKVIENEDTDYSLPVERIADSVGLSATAQKSDFDRIFPWSEIRRCNIRTYADGSTDILYEGDAGFALDGSKGNVFVEIPKHYMKRVVENGYEYRYISAVPQDGFIVDPSFVENGKELDYIYVSAYEAGMRNGRLISASGYFPKTNMTRSEYIDNARRYGEGYGILDIRTLMTLQNLFAIEYASLDSQGVLGGGFAQMIQPYNTCRSLENAKNTNQFVFALQDYSAYRKGALSVGAAIMITKYDESDTIYCENRTITNIEVNSDEKTVTVTFDGDPVDITTDMCLGNSAQKTGLSDSLLTPSGSGPAFGADAYTFYRAPVRYRYMENLWGNVWHFLDGINLSKGNTYFSTDMNAYRVGQTSSPGYIQYPIQQSIQTSNAAVGGKKEIHYMKNLGYSEKYPWLALPVSYMNEGLTERTDELNLEYRQNRFGDYYYYNSTATLYVQGGGFDHYWRCGLFTLRGWNDDSRRWYLYGTRLIYKPVSAR